MNLSSQDATIFNDAVSPVSDPSCAGIQVTSEFGEARSITLIDENGNPYVWNNVHDGIDFALPEERTCDIVSINAGVLSKNYGYGDAAKVWGCYVVVTNSSTGYMTINAHLDYTDSMARYDSFGVTTSVENRSEIGLMGNTGYSTNPHVHYEIRRGPVGTTAFYNGIPYLGTTQDEQRVKMSELTGLSIGQLSR